MRKRDGNETNYDEKCRKIGGMVMEKVNKVFGKSEYECVWVLKITVPFCSI